MLLTLVNNINDYKSNIIKDRYKFINLSICDARKLINCYKPNYIKVGSET